MGIIQCGTVKDKNEILNIIEKSINNKKTTLDRKIYEEYYQLKDLIKPQKKPERANSKEKEKESVPIISIKNNNFVSVRKRMNRFIKWYFMSHPNQQPNAKGKRNSISETKTIPNNIINNDLNHNIIDNTNKNYPNLKKNQSEGNLKNLKNDNFNISPISALNNKNNLSNNNNTNSNDFIRGSDQAYFNNTMRLSNLNLNNIQNNEISPIGNNKRVQFMLDNVNNKANQTSNAKININLNNKFKNVQACTSNENSHNHNKENNHSSHNEGIYNSFLNNKNKHFQNDSNFNNNALKLSTTLTMPNMGLDSKNVNNSNNENITNANAKIKLIKKDSCVKVIQKQANEIVNTQSIPNNLIEHKYEPSKNYSKDSSDYSSSRNLELKKTSTSNTNANSNLNLNYLNNQNVNNSLDNHSDSNKSTTARMLNNNNNDNSSNYNYNNNIDNTNNYNNNNKNFLSKTQTLNNTNRDSNSNSNSHSNNNCPFSAKEADSNSNSQGGGGAAQREKTNLFNNLYNSSQENDLHSNSIFVQQLNIFDDSNIIESNLRLSFKLSREKFQKRVAKGPPASFRWVAWLISANLPFERSRDFYAYLLTKQLNSDIDIQIKKDLNRTLSGIKISNFLLDDTQLALYNILKAFALVDTEVSYCQGMNFIVGFLLVISDFSEIETFYFMLAIFSQTFKDNLGIRGFFLEGFPLLNFYVSLFLSLFSKNLPELKKHFEKLEIPDEVWISKWFRTLFTLSLPFDICMRIWDCLVTLGLDFLLNFTLAFMKQLEPELLRKQDLFEVIEFFKKMSPFFAMENEGEDALIAESEKFIEAFNIEEIILNAKKIKISPIMVQEHMLLYEKKHKISFEKLKVKYNLNFEKKEDYSQFNFLRCDSHINIEDSRRNSIGNHQYENNFDARFNNQFGFNSNSNHNPNFKFDDNIENSIYSLQGEKRNGDFYINTDTCRSEIEKIKNNLESKNTNLGSSTTLNLNFSNNNLHVYTENNLQNMQSSESNKDLCSKNLNSNVIESEMVNESFNNKLKLKYNNSGEIEHSPTNSDTDLNADDIQDKIISYTFKAKSNINVNFNRFALSKEKGKID